VDQLQTSPLAAGPCRSVYYDDATVRATNRFYPQAIRCSLVMVSLLLITPAQGDERKRLQLAGELNLSALIEDLPGTERRSHWISQIKISDDDRWIAVDLVDGHRGSSRVKNHHLLLVSADLKTDTAEQFDFDGRRGGESTFFLSPDASIIVIEDGVEIDVEDRRNRSSCSLWPPVGDPQILVLGRFIDADLFLVTRYRPLVLQDEKSRYELYDRNCKLRDTWELVGGSPATADPGSGRILVQRYLGGTQWETELVEWPSRKLVGRWPILETGLATDKGRVLCFGSLTPSQNLPIQCLDVASGALLAKQVVIHGGYPMAVARSGTLAVANDWFKLWKPFTEGDYWLHVKRQVLWDFRSGQVLASWNPKLQHDDSAGYSKNVGFGARRFPFVYALSNVGTFIVEGGDETIRMSRILGP
jgi:hypothetical protein